MAAIRTSPFSFSKTHPVPARLCYENIAPSTLSLTVPGSGARHIVVGVLDFSFLRNVCQKSSHKGKAWLAASTGFVFVCSNTILLHRVHIPHASINSFSISTLASVFCKWLKILDRVMGSRLDEKTGIHLSHMFCMDGHSKMALIISSGVFEQYGHAASGIISFCMSFCFTGRLSRHSLHTNTLILFGICNCHNLF